MSVAGIVVAAGEGSRFEKDRRKQFVELLSKPVLQYSLELFDEIDEVTELVVVGPDGDLDRIRDLINQSNLDVNTSVVEGGNSRFESVRSGLNALGPRSDWTILIHDAARPGADFKLVRRLLDEYFNNNQLKGVIPVTNITSTVKKIDGPTKTIDRTVDRENLRTSQTPQLFELEGLREAVEAWTASTPPTDEAELMERAGFSVGYVQGSLKCRKITYRKDLRLLKLLIRDDPRAES